MRLTVILVVAVACSAASADDAKSSNPSAQSLAAAPRGALECSTCYVNNWCVADTPNFHICWSTSEKNVRDLAVTCESLAAKSKEHWLTKEQSQNWVPRCEVIVHPGVREYVQCLGRGSEQTSGCATLRLDQGRVVSRRIDLRADALDWKTESLPHELVHVVLADRFCRRRIPPWADEGIAMLAESPAKLGRRLDELRQVAARGTVYSFQDLMRVTTHPEPAFRPAFYGQSVALASYLLEYGTRRQLLDFVEKSQVKGVDAALREVYGNRLATELERGMREYISTDRLVRRTREPIIPVTLQMIRPSATAAIMD